MENKKTIIGIVILIILIISICVGAYTYNKKNTEQLSLLTDETNKILQTNLSTDQIDLEIKTEKNYAIVEKAIKEYTSKVRNVYLESNELIDINPNDVFTGNNVEEQNFDKVEEIILDYKTKFENCQKEYNTLIKDENIIEYIEEKNITTRKDYYVNLYKTAMLSDVMKEKYTNLQSKIEKIADKVTDNVSKLEKIEKFLEDNNKFWKINEEGKIEFSNINKMTEYYNLLNR